jgi:hypothetical protein
VEPARGFAGRFIATLLAQWRTVTGKYVLAWILGVPVIVLVIIYFFVH